MKNKLLVNLISVFCLFLPFQIALNPLPGVDLALARIFVIGILFFWLAEGLRKKELTIKFDFQSFFLIAFLFLATLSMFFSQNMEWFFRKWIFLIAFFPLFFVLVDIFKNKEATIKIINYLILGAFLTAGVSIFQFSLQFIIGLENSLLIWRKITPFFLGESFSQAVITNSSWLVNVGGKTIFRAVSFFPDPHIASFYFGMILPLAFVFILMAKKEMKKIYIISFVIILLADLLTFSRGGYLGLFCGIFFLASTSFLNRNNKKEKTIIFLLFVFCASLFLLPSFQQRLLSVFNINEGSNAGRILIWKEALGVIKNNPNGVGLGNYPLAINPTANYRDPIYAHNLYLDISSEIGIGGLIAWLGIIFLAIKNCLKLGKDSVVYIGVVSSLIVFTVHSFFETALFSVHILPLFIIMISLTAKNK